LRVIDAEEGSKSHPLEKQHRPSTRSKKKKYVENTPGVLPTKRENFLTNKDKEKVINIK